MNQRQLSYFLEVYKRKNISQAAEALFISPQALSKTIASLEKELDVDLFVHKSNHIVPTKEAANLASHAMHILDEYDIIENKLFHSESTRRSLPISCSYDVPQLLHADFFHEFYAAHPDIELQLKEYPDNAVIRQLERGDIELAIIPGPLDSIAYAVEPLFSMPFCLVIHKDHPLAAKDAIELADLDGLPLVVKDVSTATSQHQIAHFTQNNITLNIILETTDAHLIHDMAKKGHAIGMTLSYLADNIQSDEIVIRPFAHKWFQKTLYLAHKKDFILSPESEAFRDAILAFVNS